MIRRFTQYILLAGAAAVMMGSCGEGGMTGRRLPLSPWGRSPKQESSDTLHTADRAMAVYAHDRRQALLMIDSAQTVGNLTAEQADLLRATVYCRTIDAPRLDSAIVISERLLDTRVAKTDPDFRQSLLEVLVYSTRQLEDHEMQLVYSTQLAEAYASQGNSVEALRTEAEVGAVLFSLKKTDEGLAKMDSVIRQLAPVRQFNELDAAIIAMKRKIGVVRDYPLIVQEAQRMLSCLDDYEQHPADFHDGSLREPDDAERPAYVAFYRAQAWAYLAAAYAHIGGHEAQARHYLSLAEQSDFGHTLAGKKMLAPTHCLLGEYAKMEAIYRELETVFTAQGDTLTLDYAQLLLDRAKAAQGQGRLAESTVLWEKHALILQKAEERLLRSKASLYAARYHAQEQMMAISRQKAEIARSNIIIAALAIGLVALLALFVYGIHLLRVFKRKNTVLAREISEAVKYREQYESLMAVPNQEDGAAEQDADSPGSMGNEQLFQHIRQVVIREKLFLEPTLNRQKLTDRFALTKDQLGAAFAKGSPYSSITDFINDCRLQYAARLLTERPDLSITEVAEASGFARPATFTANFKQRYSITPNQYRAQNQAR